MIKIKSSNGNIAYDIYEYVVDNANEINALPAACGMGSTAIVISTVELYIKNGEGKWVKL